MHQAYTWSKRHAAWHARIHSLHESITVLQKACAQFMSIRYTSGHMASGLYVHMYIYAQNFSLDVVQPANLWDPAHTTQFCDVKKSSTLQLQQACIQFFNKSLHSSTFGDSSTRLHMLFFLNRWTQLMQSYESLLASCTSLHVLQRSCMQTSVQGLMMPQAARSTDPLHSTRHIHACDIISCLATASCCL